MVSGDDVTADDVIFDDDTGDDVTTDVVTGDDVTLLIVVFFGLLVGCNFFFCSDFFFCSANVNSGKDFPVPIWSIGGAICWVILYDSFGTCGESFSLLSDSLAEILKSSVSIPAACVIAIDCNCFIVGFVTVSFHLINTNTFEH